MKLFTLAFFFVVVVVVVVVVIVAFVIVVGCARSGCCVNPTKKRPRTDLQREFGEFGHVTVRTSGVVMVVFWLWGILVAIPELCKNMQKPLLYFFVIICFVIQLKQL